MKKTIILLSLFLIVSMLTMASAENESVVGSWEFSTPQAPWEFNKGSFNFVTEEDGGYTGAIQFHTGQIISMQEVTVDGEAVLFDINIGGSIVNADCMVDGSTMTCDLTTMQGPMQVTATKVVEDQE